MARRARWSWHERPDGVPAVAAGRRDVLADGRGPGAAVKGSAVLSPCERFRYVLTRPLGAGRNPLTVVGLNPSTADATTDDQTVRRLVGFARTWGMDGLVLLNAYALRSTDPKVMLAADDRVGPENDEWLRKYMRAGGWVLAAWGAHCEPEREERVRELARESHAMLWCLGTTVSGAPKHPLRLAKTTRPVRWAGRS